MEEEIKKYKSTRRDSKEETRGWSKGKRAGRHETLEGRKKQPKKKYLKKHQEEEELKIKQLEEEERKKVEE